jgi:putative nucleotidyltransferase with HDIG domain
VRAERAEEELVDHLWALRDLPPLPWIATRVLGLLSRQADEVESKQLIELLQADAALSAELLRRANSALYAFRWQILSLQHAVVILGLDKVRNLAMTLGLGAYLRPALRAAVLRRCWRHSLTCALLSEHIAPAWGIPADQTYAAGLLHDIGRLALLVKHPQSYADLLSVETNDRSNVLDAERELFNVDHCEAGAWLAEKWNFPKLLAQVVARHHDPPANDPFDILKLVHVTCRLTDSLGFYVIEAAQPEQTADILAELPERTQARLETDLKTLEETLERKVNALE